MSNNSTNLMLDLINAGVFEKFRVKKYWKFLVT